MRKNQSTIHRYKKPLIYSLVVVLLVGSGLAYLASHNNNQSLTEAPSSSDEQPLTVVAKPPTEQEKQAVEDHKESLPDQSNTNQNNNTSDKKSVTVTIVNSNQSGDSISVSGYISGVVENGGTCTLTITKGSTKYTGTSSGFANVNTTNCPMITINSASGTGWTAVLSYESSVAAGASGAKTL